MTDQTDTPDKQRISIKLQLEGDFLLLDTLEQVVVNWRKVLGATEKHLTGKKPVVQWKLVEMYLKPGEAKFTLEPFQAKVSAAEGIINLFECMVKLANDPGVTLRKDEP